MNVRAYLIGLLVFVSSGAGAQSTAGSIFGHGPAGASVTAVSSNGSQRHATINSSGRYSLTPLPMGTYTVKLEKDGKLVDTMKNVPIVVGRGREVDFACENDKCDAGS
ncbi:carboxypeptidase-like regulatory domain-containing protein [Bacillus sp. NP157]|nr:carboxypeptidase-like regulatory domain-containing protein [Bacillus sp. NP157]